MWACRFGVAVPVYACGAMRFASLVAVAVLACGCIRLESPADAQQQAQATLAAERDRQQQEREKREAAARQAREAEAERRRLETMALGRELDLAAARREAEAAELCGSDRTEREVEMQRRMESVARVNDLIDWESAHCKSVDNSKPVVRVVQDSTGEYHTVAGRDRGVDRVCDAKMPKEIVNRAADTLPVYNIPRAIDLKNQQCKERDAAVSDVAAHYWNLR